MALYAAGGSLYPVSAGSAGLTQAASYFTAGAGSEGDLAQLPDGRVMRYSEVASAWLPPEIEPALSLHELDLATDPTTQGWAEVGGPADWALGSTYNHQNGFQGCRYEFANANLEAAQSWGILIDCEVTALPGGDHEENFCLGARSDGTASAVASLASTNTNGAFKMLAGVAGLDAGVGEGPSPLARHAWLMAHHQGQFVKVACLDTLFEGASFPVNNLEDGSAYLPNANAVRLFSGTAGQAVVTINKLSIFTFV